MVTADGAQVITKFPAEDLMVAGRYWTACGQPNTLRDAESHLNTAAGRGEIPARRRAAAHQEPALQSAAQHVQPQVECGTRMGKSADGDEIDAGLRDRPGLLQP